jgi:predicted transcriptional regulator of viral defense system
MKKRMSTRQAVRVIGRPIFTTGEVARLTQTATSVATRVLGSMAKHGEVTRVLKGVWCQPQDPRFSIYALIHYLSGAHRAYVSFLSAMHLHGIIEQIPQIVHAATTGHTKLRRTPVGTFAFHRITPSLFGGLDWYREGREFLIATPEKALVDSLYLSSRRGKAFGHFPELEFGPSFGFRRARQWARRIPAGPIQRHVVARLGQLQAARGQHR